MTLLLLSSCHHDDPRAGTRPSGRCGRPRAGLAGGGTSAPSPRIARRTVTSSALLPQSEGLPAAIPILVPGISTTVPAMVTRGDLAETENRVRTLDPPGFLPGDDTLHGASWMTGLRRQEGLGNGGTDGGRDATASRGGTALRTRDSALHRIGPYSNERCGPPIHKRVLVVITSGESGHDGAELARRGFPIRTGRHVPISGIPQPARRERRRARLSERIKPEILAKRPRGEAVVRAGLEFQYRKPSTGSDPAKHSREAPVPEKVRSLIDWLHDRSEKD